MWPCLQKIDNNKSDHNNLTQLDLHLLDLRMILPEKKHQGSGYSSGQHCLECAIKIH